MSTDDIIKKHPKELIDYAKALYDRQAADFDTLDKKALGVIGIAGLLVGFQALNIDTTAQLVQCLNADQCICLPLFSLIFLVIHGICLVLSILQGLAAFQVKDIYYPEGIAKLIQKADTDEKILSEIVDTYDEVAADFAKINEGKAAKLKYSVNSITIAMLALIAFMLFMVIFKCK